MGKKSCFNRNVIVIHLFTTLEEKYLKALM